MPDTGQDGEQPRPAQPSATVTDAATGASPDAGGPAPAASPASDRMLRFTPANMIRSLLPLLVICLVIVGVTALRQNPEDPVRDVDPTSAQRAVAALAGYELLVPTDLPEGWRSTSVRTDAGSVQAGDPVTLEIGWFTPGEEYAGYVISDDPGADAVADVLDGAAADGTAQVDGQTWDRLETQRGETALTRVTDGATLVVTGSATEEELTTLAGSLEPYAPGS
ncbi:MULTISPECIES: DUF4245 domain-containing protein [unclassified Modestobacter]|uniref:DUF4245 domain-containing protein n=1 Tax=unclassified Modestobacter TaxID=2643866 RepID=UPI0022AAA103|nr:MULTISPECIES: DUF4245 domain-containing protein [unclassified Modestobacter]MCZ2825083.1 DUF4245 domain-containing protein [Modestobacter sp. VKM Ac-2981]MCZ2853852.1 DUF4245 domain-containing protein [Modestobacter sp. VKM Ac-2982]